MSKTQRHQLFADRKAFCRLHRRQYHDRHRFDHDTSLEYYKLYDGVPGKHRNHFMYDSHHSDNVAEDKASEELRLFKRYGEVDVDIDLTVLRPKALRVHKPNRRPNTHRACGMPSYHYYMPPYRLQYNIKCGMYINTWFKEIPKPMPELGACVHRWARSMYMNETCCKCGLSRRPRINEN